MLLPILAFDTSAAHCAAALLLPDRVILRLEPMEKGQAERLMPLLEELLAEGGHRLARPEGVGGRHRARATSPASGSRWRRRGGWRWGLGIPAVGVTRLEALAYGLPRPLTVIEDARRGEVYVQDFHADGPGPARIVAARTSCPCSDATGSAAGPAPCPQPCRWPKPSPGSARSVPRRPQPRPAPFYLRGADAAPPSDPPPVILP